MIEEYTYSQQDYNRDLLELRARELSDSLGMPFVSVLKSLLGEGVPPTIEEMHEAAQSERELQNEAAAKHFKNIDKV